MNIKPWYGRPQNKLRYHYPSFFANHCAAHSTQHIAFNCCQLLPNASNCFQMLSITELHSIAANYCQLLTIIQNCYQLLTAVVICCHLLSIAVSGYQLLPIAAICCQFLWIAARCCQFVPSAAHLCQLLSFAFKPYQLLRLLPIAGNCWQVPTAADN